MKINKENFFAELNNSRNLKKFNLANNKINLSLVDDIQDYINTSYLTDIIEERIDEAQTKMMEARDIFRFDMMQSLGAAEDELNVLETQISDLGLDTPPIVDNFKQQIAEVESQADDLRRKFQDAGWDPIS